MLFRRQSVLLIPCYTGQNHAFPDIPPNKNHQHLFRLLPNVYVVKKAKKIRHYTLISWPSEKESSSSQASGLGDIVGGS